MDTIKIKEGINICNDLSDETVLLLIKSIESLYSELLNNYDLLTLINNEFNTSLKIEDINRVREDTVLYENYEDVNRVHQYALQHGEFYNRL